jgi:hypothetical protein
MASVATVVIAHGLARKGPASGSGIGHRCCGGRPLRASTSCRADRPPDPSPRAQAAPTPTLARAAAESGLFGGHTGPHRQWGRYSPRCLAGENPASDGWHPDGGVAGIYYRGRQGSRPSRKPGSTAPRTRRSPLARRKAGEIVGRDTTELDEQEIARAAVETVAENTVDACVAPLFFTLLGGAPGAMAYRAINTLDSMLGHKNATYLHFGWASARLDDLANWLPARLAALIMPLAAACVGRSATQSWRAILRDARKHPSPNSGIPEAAVAGALGIQLGGINFYKGIPEKRALLGEKLRPLERHHIAKAISIMIVTSVLSSALFLLAGLALGR